MDEIFEVARTALLLKVSFVTFDLLSADFFAALRRAAAGAVVGALIMG